MGLEPEMNDCEWKALAIVLPGRLSVASELYHVVILRASVSDWH